MLFELKVVKYIEGSKGIFELEGAINVTTAIKLENELRDVIDKVNDLVFDFKKVTILTSAGIRVLMAANKEIVDRGTLSIINCPDNIKEIFEMTCLLEDLHVN